MQDNLISKEVRYMITHKITDPLLVDREIISAIKELDNDTFNSNSILLQ